MFRWIADGSGNTGRFQKKHLLFCILAVILLMGCAGADTGAKDAVPEKTSGSKEDSLSGEAAFEGQDMEGNPVSSDMFSESKLTMINVWATYCSPCLNEMPALGELSQEYDSEDFQIIGIVSDVPEGADEETVSLVETLIAQTSAGYPHLLFSFHIPVNLPGK